MQVSGELESEKFTMMGGGKTHSFSIKQSAHTFRVLTNSLYGDKYLAVAREVICNIVDIHRRHNIDAPVEIILTDNEVKFIDKGPGICDSAIASIYLTFFGSDKTDDPDQIGGFGLGCKSPFALSEHFRVESNHKGFKRVYAMTIGSAETNGEPGATEMVCVPTTDTGLVVAVPISDANSRHLMEKAILRVVRYGGIKATLNGAPVTDCRDYTELRKAGYGYFDHKNNAYGPAVLYGDVLYPIENNDGIANLFWKFNQLTPGGYQAVLYAPPSSLAITPSREKLSYEDKTVATLKRLMERCIKEVTPRIPRQRKIAFLEALNGQRRHQYAIAVSERVFVRMAMPDTGTIVGSLACANLIARHGLMTSRTVTPDLHRLAMSQYRDHRPKIYGKQPKSDLLTIAFNRAPTFDARRDHWRYVMQRLMRALLPTVEKPELIYRSGTYNTFERMRSLTWHFCEPMRKLAITIATSRTAAVTAQLDGIVLVGRFKDDQIAEIKANLARYHFQLLATPVVEKKVVKKKAPKVTSDLFSPFDKTLMQFRGFDRYNRYIPAKPSLVIPEVFLPLSITRMRDKDDVFIPALDAAFVAQVTHPDIGDLYKNCAVPLHVKERDRLVDLGVPRMGEHLLKKVMARLDAGKDDLFTLTAGLIHRKDYNDYGYRNHCPRRFATQTAQVSRRLACAVFGEPYRKSAKLDECWQFWREVSTFFKDAYHGIGWLDATEHNAFLDHHKQFEALMNDLFKSMPASRTLLKRIYNGTLKNTEVQGLEFLASILDSDFYKTDDEERLARLIEADVGPKAKTPVTNDNEELQCAA